MKLKLNQKFKSLDPFEKDLPDYVVLTGVNGAGKTHLLQAPLKIYDNDGKRLYFRRYETSQTLIPVIINHHIAKPSNFTVSHEWQFLKNYLEEKSRDPDYLDNSPILIFIDKIAQKANKKKEELTADDFFLFHPIEDEKVRDRDIFHHSFSTIFKNYSDKIEDNLYREFRFKEKKHSNISFLNEEEFLRAFGEAPWDLVNNIFKQANLDYTINTPENNHRDEFFELRLISNHNGKEVRFEDLSSGEQVIMSLVLAFYNSNYDVTFPQVLLLDEPDASLHPSMTKQFLDVIQKVFVKDKGVKVIMTTHSPSTVALAPEENLFVVNKSGNRIEKITKDKALKILTSGVPSFSVNYENRRQIFVESPYDVLFYDKFYQVLSSYLIPEISLTFISSGESKTNKNGTKDANCQQVYNITNILRNAGNKFVYGIIDWDLINVSTDAVKVLGNGNRYSIENYILDPLLIGALLLRQKIITKENLGLKNDETYIDLKNFNYERLQFIVDFITNKLESEVNQTEVKLREVKLLNGIKIKIPLWYLNYQGHSLEKQILKVFPELNAIKKEKEETLKLEILNKIVEDIPGILSVDILEILKAVQTED